jgi:hypothetical protein
MDPKLLRLAKQIAQQEFDRLMENSKREVEQFRHAMLAQNQRISDLRAQLEARRAEIEDLQQRVPALKAWRAIPLAPCMN